MAINEILESKDFRNLRLFHEEEIAKYFFKNLNQPCVKEYHKL